MTNVKLTRIETGYNRGWIEANPELFTRSILQKIDQRGLENYTFTIEPAYMPGEFIQLVARLKEGA